MKYDDSPKDVSWEERELGGSMKYDDSPKDVSWEGQELGRSIKYDDSPKEVASWGRRELGGKTVTSVAWEKSAEVLSIGWMNVGEAEVMRVVPCWMTTSWWFYREDDKSLAGCILFDGENISFDASLGLYIYIYI